MTTHLQECRCPHCDRVNDRYSGAPGTKASEGDISICWGCKKISIFDGKGGQRIPTAEELAEALDDRDVLRAIKHAHLDATPTIAVKRSLGSS